MAKKIIEAGHYYVAHGPTKWSLLGVDILNRLKTENDETMLFIDDFHGIENVSSHEINLEIIEFKFSPNHVVYESDMSNLAKEILIRLLNLPRNKRVKVNNATGQYFLSGFPVTKKNGDPCCVLLDAALSLYKYKLGFNKIVNILPYFYSEEQLQLLKILSKIMPEDFNCEIHLFDENGAICDTKILRGTEEVLEIN